MEYAVRFLSLRARHLLFQLRWNGLRRASVHCRPILPVTESNRGLIYLSFAPRSFTFHRGISRHLPYCTVLMRAKVGRDIYLLPYAGRASGLGLGLVWLNLITVRPDHQTVHASHHRTS